MNTPDCSQSTLLFSIDLEEFYPADISRDPGSSELSQLVSLYLDLLRETNVHGTFFVVGDVARKFPALIKSISAAGHEIGCHGNKHITLDQMTPESFAEDLILNRAAIEAATGIQVSGFRAPLLSLTERTKWAYPILARQGFRYSSSVLPARNPLFGWPEFGYAPRFLQGIWEIPVTLRFIPCLGTLPFLCGTYFRILPWWLIKQKLPQEHAPETLVSYFHPYDVDYRQPWTMHAGVKGNRILNTLLFLRRKSLPNRIKQLLKMRFASTNYEAFITSLRA